MNTAATRHRWSRITRRLAHLSQRLKRTKRIDAEAVADAVTLLDESQEAFALWLNQGQAVAASINEALEALRGLVAPSGANADDDRQDLIEFDLGAILADTRCN